MPAIKWQGKSWIAPMGMNWAGSVGSPDPGEVIALGENDTIEIDPQSVNWNLVVQPSGLPTWAGRSIGGRLFGEEADPLIKYLAAVVVVLVLLVLSPTE